jgi:hypothetical protein
VNELIGSPGYGKSNDADKREKIGEIIYTYIANAAGEDNAPKITGMIIDLPLKDLEKSISNWTELQEKISEGQELLVEEQS